MMESEEIDDSSPDLLQEIDLSGVDVESIVSDLEMSVSEQNASMSQEESEPVPGTSSEGSVTVEKENLPPKRKRPLRFPLNRVKQIMKTDPDCTIVSHDSVFLITKATEMFLEYLGKESAKYTHTAKRKTVLKRDVEAAIDSIPHLCFLEGTLD